jgi:hypothetical protein
VNTGLSRQLVAHPRFQWRTGMMAVPFPNREQGLMPDLDDAGTIGILLSYLQEASAETDISSLSATLHPGDSIALRLLAAWGPP